MSNRGATAVKAIVIMGVVTFLFLFLVSQGLRRTVQRVGDVPVPAQTERLSPFDAARAQADLEAIVAIGPRPTGSPGAEATRAYLSRQLDGAGLQPVMVHQDGGPVHVMATCEGTEPDCLALATHYDTWHSPDFAFLGANSGASGTVWLLEMARAFGASREGLGIRFVWLDAEEQQTEATGPGGNDLLEMELPPVALIYVDMIGDRLLRIRQDADAPAWLREPVWDAAKRLGYRRNFGTPGPELPGPHRVLRGAGIPALALIDFSYGGSALKHKENYHTPNDTLGLVSVESLRAVADVIYHALPSIEENARNHSSVKE